MLKVLVIDESKGRAAEICAGLALAGHQVAAILPDTVDLSAKVSRLKPDVVLIETDSPSRDTLEHLSAMERDAPRPVIIFAQEGPDATIRASIRAGVSAYVVDGLDAARLKPIIDVAVARFDAHQEIKQELARATQKLSERKLVEKAKGILMKSRGMDEESAFVALRKLAMDRGQPIAAVAKNVIDMASLLL